MKGFYYLSCVVLLSYCGRKEESIQPTVQHITESVYASGIVRSKNQYQVFSPVNGIISDIRTQEGEPVKKGEVIMKLANEASRLSVENAQILSRYSSPQSNKEKLNQLSLSIQLTKEKLRNDSLLLERQKNLWKAEIGSRNQLEQRELAFQSSKSEYEGLVLRYVELKKQISLSSLQSSKQLQISKTLANDFYIRAKTEGVLYQLLKEPGEMVTTQTAVAIIGDDKDFILELSVDEYDVSKITPGQRMFITMDSYKGDVFEGTVNRIIPIMNESSRSFTVEASFTKLPPRLYPNLTAQANILIRIKENAMTIPRNYLTAEDVVILADGTKKKVVTGMKDYQRVEIISGLSKTDRIRKP
jgi:HlyD family secretion protein